MKGLLADLHSMQQVCTDFVRKSPSNKIKQVITTNYNCKTCLNDFCLFVGIICDET